MPAGSTVVAQRWTFCPLSAGAVTAYACAVPQCEVDARAGPGRLGHRQPHRDLAACLGFGGGVIPAERPGPAPDRLPLPDRHRRRRDSRDAVLQIPQWTRSAPPDPNLPPVILGVEIGGVPAQVGVPTPPLPVDGILPVRLLIDPASVQTFVDAAGVTQTETMTGYFYTTGGTFPQGITTGVDTTTDLEGTGLPPRPDLGRGLGRRPRPARRAGGGGSVHGSDRALAEGDPAWPT